MNIQHTSNNIPYETNWSAKLVCLLPIKGVHSEIQVDKAMKEVQSKYIFCDTRIDWQKP